MSGVPGTEGPIPFSMLLTLALGHFPCFDITASVVLGSWLVPP